jgi:hypothetical protein
MWRSGVHQIASDSFSVRLGDVVLDGRRHPLADLVRVDPTRIMGMARDQPQL